MTASQFDSMTSEQAIAYINEVELSVLMQQLSECSFACLKRTYVKYFGINPVSTMKRSTMEKAFWHRRIEMQQATRYKYIKV